MSDRRTRRRCADPPVGEPVTARRWRHLSTSRVAATFVAPVVGRGLVGSLPAAARATATIAGGASPDERSRGGALVVLSAWVMMTVAGLVVQKTSEQWQAASGGSTVFDVVKLAAGIGSAMILTGIAAAVPALARYVRAGGWIFTAGRSVGPARPQSRPELQPLLLSGLGSSVRAQRNGSNVAYSLHLHLACAMLIVTSLVMWAAAAIATGRRLELSPREWSDCTAGWRWG